MQRYRLLMANYAIRYPDGVAGLGLLLVRACYASVAFGVAAMPPPVPVATGALYVTAGLIALALVAGFATRGAALLLGAAVIAALPASAPVQQLLLAGHAGGCAAMVLLGAGAFSIDARRHGRRVIHLRTSPPDRGEPD